MATPRILAFSGSTREKSFNKKLLAISVQGALDAGASVTTIDLRDFAMPLYDGDLDEQSGMPESALALRKIFLEHDALLIASPEYNASISGVLKNTLDWVSRGTKTEPTLACFQRKVAAVISASQSGLGGTRGLPELRRILGSINVIVIPEQIGVAKAGEAFDAEGNLKDQKQVETAKKVGRRLAEVTAALLG